MEKAGSMADAAAQLHERVAMLPALEAVDACNAFWRTWGTLPSRPTDLSGLRKAKLRELRQQAKRDRQPPKRLARRLGITLNRFYRLTSPSSTGSEATA